jgi:prepilin peptidase CpaA
MTFWTPTLPFQLIYVSCVAYAILSDIRYLMIPNWVSAVLAVTFLPYCVLFWPALDLISRLEITSGIFLLALLFYYFNWFGGGDVKFLTAVSLWVGPMHIAAFGLLMAVLGSLLALLLLNLRWLVNSSGTVWQNRFPSIVRRWTEQGVCPYGVAIGVAGLAMGPRIFA